MCIASSQEHGSRGVRPIRRSNGGCSNGLGRLEFVFHLPIWAREARNMESKHLTFQERLYQQFLEKMSLLGHPPDTFEVDTDTSHEHRGRTLQGQSPRTTSVVVFVYGAFLLAVFHAKTSERSQL